MKPIGIRLFIFLSKNFYDVAVSQRMVKRNHFSVHARANRSVSDVRVNPVRNVYRRGPLGEVKDISFRRKNENPILEKIDFQGFEKFARVFEFLLPLAKLQDPRSLLSLCE